MTDLHDTEDREHEPPADAGTEGGGVEDLVEELIEIVTSAKSMPLSSSAIVTRDEVLDLLEAIRDELPEELRRARRMLKDHEELLAAARREAADIVGDARVQAERMVQRTEIVRQAEHRAVRIVEDAEASARQMRHEAEDYVDQKLAGFEIVLDRTMKTVRTGRERLASIPAPQAEPGRGRRRRARRGRVAGRGGLLRPGPRVTPKGRGPFLVGVAQLRKNPGTRRKVQVAAPIAELEVSGSRVPPTSEVVARGGAGVDFHGRASCPGPSLPTGRGTAAAASSPRRDGSWRRFASSARRARTSRSATR